MIYTVTLNPAFDLHYYLDSFSPFEDNFANYIETEAGGKGINVSRVLNNLGIENKAYFLSGKENETRFLNLLDGYGINYDYISVNGKIRENVSLHSLNADDTRICVNGFRATDEAVDALLKKLKSVIVQDDVLIFSGRLPVNVSKLKIINNLLDFRNAGVKLYIDCASFELADFEALKPYFVKPNRNEANALFRTDDALSSAEKLFELGIENSCITLGGQGAVYACSHNIFTASVKKIKAVSTVGAGDAFTAGFAAAVEKGYPPEKRIRFAVACGSASALEKGTNPPLLTEVLKLSSDINIIKKTSDSEC